MGEPDVAVRHYKEALRNDPEEKNIKEAFKKMKLLEKRVSNGDKAMESHSWAEAVEGVCV
jgi:hypothetical protein